jgi:hypothetical protein
MRYALTVSALILAGALATPAARAQAAPSEAARRLYIAGSEAYAERRYPDAVRAFREAHAITHRPELLYNLGIAQAAAGEARAAVESLSLFRDAGAPGLEDRTSLDRQIAEQQQVAEQQQSAAQAGPAAAPPEVRVVERRVIEPRWYRVETRYERSAFHAIGPWATLGLGAALAVGSVVTGVSALADADIVASVNAGREPWGPTAAAAVTDGSTQATLSVALGAASGAFVTAGVLWLALRGSGRRVDVPILTALTPTVGGAALAFGGAM